MIYFLRRLILLLRDMREEARRRFDRQFVRWFEPPPIDRELAKRLKEAVREVWSEDGD